MVRAQIRQDGDPLLIGDDIGLVDETFGDVVWASLVGSIIALCPVIVDAFGLFGGGGFPESALSAIPVALIAHWLSQCA